MLGATSTPKFGNQQRESYYIHNTLTKGKFADHQKEHK